MRSDPPARYTWVSRATATPSARSHRTNRSWSQTSRSWLQLASTGTRFGPAQMRTLRCKTQHPTFWTTFPKLRPSKAGQQFRIFSRQVNMPKRSKITETNTISEQFMDQVANHLRNGNSELSPGTLEETMAVNNRLLFSQITWSQMATCAPWITRWHSTTPTGCNSSNEPPWLIPTTLTHTLSLYWAQQKRWFNTRRAQRRNAGKLLWQYHKEILYEPISLQVLMFAGFNFTESIGPTHETARIQIIYMMTDLGHQTALLPWWPRFMPGTTSANSAE